MPPKGWKKSIFDERTKGDTDIKKESEKPDVTPHDCIWPCAGQPTSCPIYSCREYDCPFSCEDMTIKCPLMDMWGHKTEKEIKALDKTYPIVLKPLHKASLVTHLRDIQSELTNIALKAKRVSEFIVRNYPTVE